MLQPQLLLLLLLLLLVKGANNLLAICTAVPLGLAAMSGQVYHDIDLDRSR